MKGIVPDKVLFDKVSSVPLALFRIAFGAVMLLQFIKFRKVFLEDFAHRSYFLKYDFFEWVQLPGNPAVLHIVFIVFIASSMLFTVGIWYRYAAFIQFLGMCYCFLIEKSIYNNHYYLFILLCVLMVWVDAADAVSMRKRKRGLISAWQLLSIRLQLFVLYFFGGIAKLNYDWLVQAQPIQIWLPDMIGSGYDNVSPWLITACAYVIAYAGLVIDISAGFLLFSKKWKWVAFCVLIIFHTLNWIMLDIGYFPLFGMVSLVVFLEKKDVIKTLRLKSYEEEKTEIQPAAFRTLTTYAFICWFLLQSFIPLRHVFLPGKVQWEMNGYLFSWYMKLNDYAPVLRFEVIVPGNPAPFTFEIDKLSESPMQRHYIATYPFITVQFALDIEAYLKKQNGISGDIQVYCDSYLSLNGRAFQRKINPMKDLTAIELDKSGKYFTSHDWIIPLGSDTLVDRTVIYRLNQFEAWVN